MPKSLQIFASKLRHYSLPARFWYVVQILIMVGAIALVLSYLLQNRSEFAQYRSIPRLTILLMLAVSGVQYVINAHYYMFLGKFYNYNLSFENSIKVHAWAMVMNILLPFRAGLAYRGWFLKKQYGLAYQEYAGLIFGMMGLSYVLSVVLALVLLGTYYFNVPVYAAIILYVLILAGIMVSGQAGSGYVLRLLDHLRWEWIRRVLLSMQRLLTNKATATVSGVFVISQLLLAAAMYWLVFRGVDARGSYDQMVFIESAASISQMAGFIPGGWGVNEGWAGLTAKVVGISAPLIVLTTVLIRFVRIGCSMLVLLIGVIVTFVRRATINTR